MIFRISCSNFCMIFIDSVILTKHNLKNKVQFWSVYNIVLLTFLTNLIKLAYKLCVNGVKRYCPNHRHSILEHLMKTCLTKCLHWRKSRLTYHRGYSSHSSPCFDTVTAIPETDDRKTRWPSYIEVRRKLPKAVSRELCTWHAPAN